MGLQRQIRDSIAVAKSHGSTAAIGPDFTQTELTDQRKRDLSSIRSVTSAHGPGPKPSLDKSTKPADSISQQSQFATSTAVDSQSTLVASQLFHRQEGRNTAPNRLPTLPTLPVVKASGSQVVTVGTDAQGWPIFVVSEDNVHDGSKIVGGPVHDVRVRHMLMAIHCGISILVTTLSGTILKDRMILCLLFGLIIAVAIYIPTAAGLTVARRRNHFDHAAGEIAYLGLQLFGWLMVSLLNIQYITYTPCDMRRRAYINGGYKWIQPYTTRCQWSAGLLGLSVAHLLLLLGWMTWIVVVVYGASPAEPNKGFQISTGWLMRGWKA